MKRYLILFIGVVLAGTILIAISRQVRVGSPRTAAAELEVVEVGITITSGHRIEPELISVPKDARVRLTVVNRDRLAASLTLMGYQDRFAAAYVEPDSSWQGEFLADRPGDDFAWMLEGAPVGRLRVTGSHLVEGHR